MLHLILLKPYGVNHRDPFAPSTDIYVVLQRYKFWRDANPNEAAQVLSHPVLNSPAGCVFNYPHGNSVPGSPIYPRSFPSTPPGHGSPLLRSSPSSYENMRLGYPYGDSLEIQHLRKMIEERDQVIAERNKMITERDAVIEERNKMLKEKEDKLRSFRESIAGVLGNYM